jgi:UDP-N-acetyl-D-mannosaminuronic acid dehydrogenase
LGLAFKADIDDLRQSPAVDVVRLLATTQPHHRVLAVEPHVNQLPQSLAELPNVELAESRDAIRESNTVVLLVDHQSFKDLDTELLRGKNIIDTRGTWRHISN